MAADADPAASLLLGIKHDYLQTLRFQRHIELGHRQPRLVAASLGL